MVLLSPISILWHDIMKNTFALILVTSIILNGMHDHKQDERLSALENKGSVTATLGDPDIIKPIIKTEYKIPSLYNNKTKIVFHNKKEFRCLAENIFFEAGNQSYLGKIAVAQTVLNRAETGKWGNSFCEVIHSPKQYSWTLKPQKKPKGPLWQASIDAARAFQYGTRVSHIENVKHYHTASVNPVWDNNMIKVASIGEHQFYGE